MSGMRCEGCGLEVHDDRASQNSMKQASRIVDLQVSIKIAIDALEFYDGRNFRAMTEGENQYVVLDESDVDFHPGHDSIIKRGGRRARKALAKIEEMLK